MGIPAPECEADATRPIAKSPMRGAGRHISAGIFSAQSGNVAQFANVERLSAFTVPGAPAPGQHEERK